jgi:2'-5' RNA ligase
LTPAGGGARVFFALWPAPVARDGLAKWAHEAQCECGGRATPAGKIHLTLVFLGNVERDRLEQLKSAAAEIGGERFELTLDQAGYWRHNRIVWAGAAAVPPALTSLVSALEERLQAFGYSFDRRPYAAHVTLLRNVRRSASLAPQPVRWPVSEFTLVESTAADRGSRYEIIGHWPLASTARPA